MKRNKSITLWSVGIAVGLLVALFSLAVASQTEAHHERVKAAGSPVEPSGGRLLTAADKFTAEQLAANNEPTFNCALIANCDRTHVTMPHEFQPPPVAYAHRHYKGKEQLPHAVQAATPQTARVHDTYDPGAHSTVSFPESIYEQRDPNDSIAMADRGAEAFPVVIHEFTGGYGRGETFVSGGETIQQYITQNCAACCIEGAQVAAVTESPTVLMLLAGLVPLLWMRKRSRRNGC